MKVEVEQVLHMVGGLGETSYATNSKIQVYKTLSLSLSLSLSLTHTHSPYNLLLESYMGVSRIQSY